MSESDDKVPYSMTLPDGSTRDGSEGYSGKAIASYENGDKYEGDFKDGLRHGQGTYTYKSGAVYTGW